jgi:hypothetical protein
LPVEIGGAALQAWLIDIGVSSDIDPLWIIMIGSSVIGFFAGTYAWPGSGTIAGADRDGRLHSGFSRRREDGERG